MVEENKVEKEDKIGLLVLTQPIRLAIALVEVETETTVQSLLSIVGCVVINKRTVKDHI